MRTRRRRERVCASREGGGGGRGKELGRSRRRTRDWRVATTARSGPLKGDPDPMEKPNALRAYHGVGPRKHNKVCPSVRRILQMVGAGRRLNLHSEID